MAPSRYNPDLEFHPMPDNPYLNVLLNAFLTVVFIVASSYGLGFIARSVVKARGATPKQQDNAFAGYFFAAPWS